MPNFCEAYWQFAVLERRSLPSYLMFCPLLLLALLARTPSAGRPGLNGRADLVRVVLTLAVPWASKLRSPESHCES